MGIPVIKVQCNINLAFETKVWLALYLTRRGKALNYKFIWDLFNFDVVHSDIQLLWDSPSSIPEELSKLLKVNTGSL